MGLEYNIVYTDKVSEVDIHHRESLWGQIDFWTRTIRIYDDGLRPDEDIWEVIIHEVLHGIAEHLEIRSIFGDQEERVISMFALGLRDFLFMNNLIVK